MRSPEQEAGDVTPYEISQDPSGFVRVTLRGYWSLNELDQFHTALDALVANHRAQPDGSRPLRFLMDGREQQVQSREVIGALQRHAIHRAGEDVRVAVVVATMIRKLQADRVSPAANRAVFFDEDEARTWLLAA